MAKAEVVHKDKLGELKLENGYTWKWSYENG